MRIFRRDGFQLSRGRYVARLRLCHELEVPPAPYLRSDFWSQQEESVVGLEDALALHDNRRVLSLLASVPDDSQVLLTVRDLGEQRALGLVALLDVRSGGRVLLLVDSRGGAKSSPARLREHVAQSTRFALSTLAKLDLREPATWTKLVVLCQWRRNIPLPAEATPLPALQLAPAVLERMPEPQIWGYVPFVSKQRMDEVHVALGRWTEFEVEPWTTLGSHTAPEPRAQWAAVPIEGYGEAAALELEQCAGRVRVSLRVKSSFHKAAMKAERHANTSIRHLRALRRACYGGHFSVGSGRFVGETLEGGVPRLHWDWVEGQAPSPEAARDAVAEALARFLKSDAATRVPRSSRPGRARPEAAPRDGGPARPKTDGET